MKIKTRRVREKATGHILSLEIKTAWDKSYYSFNGGITWHREIKDAYESAQKDGAILHFVDVCRRKRAAAAMTSHLGEETSAPTTE